MNAGDSVLGIATTRDDKWIVSGTRSGQVTVWNADSYEKMIQFQAHKYSNRERIDHTVRVWSLSTGERLLGPLKHGDDVTGVKFSPDGQLIATATWDDVRIYDNQNGRLLVNFPIGVKLEYNQSLAWASDSKQLSALSLDNNIHCLDVSTGKTLSKWLIHSSQDPACIALASNGMFIAASGGPSVSFWDTTTHKRIGSVTEHTDTVDSMAVSVNHDLVIGRRETITIQSLHNILPSPYFEESSNSKIARLEKTIRELGDELATCQRTAKEEKDRDNKTITSLRADLRTQDESSNMQIVHLEKTVQDLCDELAMSQRIASQKEDSLHKIFDSLEKTVQQLMVAQRTRTTFEYEVDMDWTAGS